MEYDAANRLVKVKTDAEVVLAGYTYGDSNERLIADEGGTRTYYASEGGTTLAEYAESGTSTVPQWSKSYVQLGGRLLATVEPGSPNEVVQYHHPDRLGTRLITAAGNASYAEQATLPYGAVLGAETTAATNRRFTSYDRSSATGLDYAVNRRYDPMQGRFTQVDPIGMEAVDLSEPQTLNLYSYCANDPVNYTDPDGLFIGRLFKWISKALKWVAVAALVATAIITVVGWVAGVAALNTFLTTTVLGKTLGFIAGIPAMIGGWIAGVPKAIAGIFHLSEVGTSVVAGVLGNGALLAGSEAAGAVANHLDKRRKEGLRSQLPILPEGARRILDRISQQMRRTAKSNKEFGECVSRQPEWEQLKQARAEIWSARRAILGPVPGAAGGVARRRIISGVAIVSRANAAGVARSVIFDSLVMDTRAIEDRQITDRLLGSARARCAGWPGRRVDNTVRP